MPTVRGPTTCSRCLAASCPRPSGASFARPVLNGRKQEGQAPRRLRRRRGDLRPRPNRRGLVGVKTRPALPLERWFRACRSRGGLRSPCRATKISRHVGPPASAPRARSPTPTRAGRVKGGRAGALGARTLDAAEPVGSLDVARGLRPVVEVDPAQAGASRTDKKRDNYLDTHRQPTPSAARAPCEFAAHQRVDALALRNCPRELHPGGRAK
jgi:hypothetical protein